VRCHRRTSLIISGGDSQHDGPCAPWRDGLDPPRSPPDRRAAIGLPGAMDVRLDSAKTQARLTTRLGEAREFLMPAP
jgi:dTDP-4-dehydrorhamnose reductase